MEKRDREHVPYHKMIKPEPTASSSNNEDLEPMPAIEVAELFRPLDQYLGYLAQQAKQLFTAQEIGVIERLSELSYTERVALQAGAEAKILTFVQQELKPEIIPFLVERLTVLPSIVEEALPGPEGNHFRVTVRQIIDLEVTQRLFAGIRERR